MSSTEAIVFTSQLGTPNYQRPPELLDAEDPPATVSASRNSADSFCDEEASSKCSVSPNQELQIEYAGQLATKALRSARPCDVEQALVRT